MSTAYTVANFGRYTPVREKQFDINLICSFTTLSLIANDTWKFCFIPAFATICSLGVIFPDMDTNVSPVVTFDLGDTGSATRFLSGNTTAQNGGSVIATGIPYRYTADDQLILKLHTAPAPSDAVNGTIYVAVGFVLDGVV